MDVVLNCRNMSNVKYTFSATIFEEAEEKRFVYRRKLKTSYGRSNPDWSGQLPVPVWSGCNREGEEMMMHGAFGHVGLLKRTAVLPASKKRLIMADYK
jgi:hypothetical protein